MSDSKQSKKPEDNAFQQQRLKAWQPLLTPNWVIGSFSFIAILFIIIGVIVLDASNSVVEKEFRYDTIDQAQSIPGTCTQASTDEQCKYTIDITITEDMDAPIYFYYKLTDFYQNHRRYVKSRSDVQLRGDVVSIGDLDACDPLSQWEDGGVQKMLYPCGLIANSFFNDTFDAMLTSTDSNGLPTTKNLTDTNWNDKNIAWKSDNDKFKPQPQNSDATKIGPGGFTLPDATNPDFKVWMRTAGLPTFKKLYRVIGDTDLKKGDVLNLKVRNVFPVKEFSGTKSIVISTTSWLGGKNSFLGWAYITVGIICAILAFAFAIKHWISPRDLGNMKYFNWPQLTKPALDQSK